MAEERELADYVAEAIQSYLDDRHEGGFATAWLATMDFIDGTGVNRWVISNPESQPVTQSLGLVEFARLSLEDDAHAFFKTTRD